MLKKEITYEDFFDEEEVTETFYFNLTERELAKFESRFNGDVEAHMTKLMRENKTEEMFDIFEGLVMSAYGVREGKEFIKTEEVREAFVNSAAYNALFVEISSDFGKLNAFLKGIIPKQIRGNFDEAEKEVERRLGTALTAPTPPTPPEAPVPPVPPTD